MTLKQHQGHQTYENVDLEQDYNHAKFERSHFSIVSGFFKQVHLSIISLEQVQKKKNFFLNSDILMV